MIMTGRPPDTAGRLLPFTWNRGHPARIGLLPRDGGAVSGGPAAVRWLEVDPCWIFHTLNAYDDGEGVVLDVCRYEGAYDVSTISGQGPLTLDRWVIDPAAGTVVTRALTTECRISLVSTTESSAGRTDTGTAR